jgi:YVTN family beta-propeller protein
VPTPHRSSFRFPVVATFAILLGLSGCHRSRFPDVPAGYREYAYVSNGGSNTVTVLDLVYLRQDHTLQVGTNPTNMAVNPTRNEVYVANAQSGTISVINADANHVVATIAVRHRPSFITVEPSGHRAYVANYGSNSVSIVDLDLRREVSVAGAGEQPVQVHISPDGRTLVVTNHGSNSVSVFDVIPYSAGSPASASATHLRSTFSGCPGAADTVILPDSSKAFVACSAGHQVMALGVAAAPGSWAAKQNPSLTTDRMLALLDVGKMPVHLAMKPDGGEIFVSNFDSDSFSEIATWTNEVGGTYSIGNKPVRGIVSRDNSTLWVANSGADSIGLYSIDDGKLAGSVRTGSSPDALAFSADEHLLLAADTHSGDVAVIRTEGKQGPALFTILPAGISPNDIVVKALREK